jgi:hypothetical protein
MGEASAIHAKVRPFSKEKISDEIIDINFPEFVFIIDSIVSFET